MPRRRLAGLIAILLFLVGSVKAREKIQGYCEQGGKTVTTLSYLSATKVQESFPSCTVTVYRSGVLFPLPPIYEDNLGTPKFNPFTAASDGYWYFYADQDRYDVRFSGTSPTFTRGDWLLFDPDEADIKLLNDGTVYADRMPGADWCVQINNAVALLGNRPGRIVYSAFSGTKTCTAQPVLPYPRQVLYLQTGTYVLNKKGWGVSALMGTANGVEIYGDGIGKTVLLMGTDAQDEVIRVATSGNVYWAAGVGSPPIYDVSVHDLEVDNTAAAMGPNDTYQNAIHIETPVRCRVYRTRVRGSHYQGIVLGGANWCSGAMIVNTNGVTVTVTGGDTDFYSFWRLPGGVGPVPADKSEATRVPIEINGRFYQIASLTNSSTAVLATTAGVQAGVTARIYLKSHNVVDGNIAQRAGEFGIGIQGAISHTIVSGNLVGDTGPAAHGIEMKGASGHESDYNVISNNEIRSVSGYGMWIEGSTRYLSIIGNTVVQSKYGIYADSYIPFTYPNTNLSILGNKISDANDACIVVSGGATTFVGPLIEGNEVSRCRGNGIIVVRGDQTLIRSNRVSAVSGQGIQVLSAGALISGNVVTGAGGSGVDVFAGSTGAMVIDNMLVGNGVGFADGGALTVAAFNRVTAASRTTTLTGNLSIEGDQAAVINLPATGGAARGINWDQAGVGNFLAYIDGAANFHLQSGGNNRLSITPLGALYNIPSIKIGQTAEDIPVTGHKSVTAAYDPPNLANGAVHVAGPTNVAGCEPSDTVAVGFDSITNAGWLIVGQATASGVVSTVLMNMTGGAVNLPPGTLRVDCWKH